MSYQTILCSVLPSSIKETAMIGSVLNRIIFSNDRPDLGLILWCFFPPFLFTM